MSKRGQVGIVLAWVLLGSVPGRVYAQGTAEDYARAERFLPSNLDGLVLNERVTPNWIGRSDRFWYRRDLPDGEEFVVVDAARNTRRPAFDHARLAAGLASVLGREVQANRLPLERFEFTDDETAIEVWVDSARWRCSLATYECAAAEPRSEEPAGRRRMGRSPDGKWEVFVRDHNLYVRSTETGEEIQLTHDGERYYAYATPLPSPTAMIRQGTEEPVQPPAVSWSPDSKRFITYRLDARKAGRLSMVQHAPPDRVRPYFYTYVYPLPEDSVLPTAEPIIFEVGTWRRIPVQMEPIQLQYFGGPSVGTWFQDGQRLYVLVNDRGFTWREVREIDARTGAVRVLIREEGDPYVDTSSGAILRFLDQGEEILWGSERDGWMHLYLYDGRTGRLVRQVTKGEWVVRGIVHVDEKARVVYFTAGGREAGRDPYLVHLYRIGLDGRGLRLLTPEDAEHSVVFSPSGRYFVDTYSRPDLPPVSVLRRASDGALVRELERADIEPLLATGWKFPEPFRAKARDGKTDIYGIIWRPSTFDPSKTYPVVEQIYTGPQGFFVPKSFGRALRNSAQSIAELGFIVVQIDGLGTAGRSRAFHNFSYKNLGDGGIPDHIAALRQMAEKYPYMDLTRVGIYGHSAGGYDAAHAMLTHPEFYKVGVASAGNHDHRMDKAWWNTQWMGYPVGDHYREQSNVTLAHRLQGKLLLVHGDVDENVPVSATLQFVNALIEANKDFELLILPNQNHGFGDHPYFVRKRWDFFVKHLLGVEPPAWDLRPRLSQSAGR